MDWKQRYDYPKDRKKGRREENKQCGNLKLATSFYLTNSFEFVVRITNLYLFAAGSVAILRLYLPCHKKIKVRRYLEIPV